MAMKKYFSLVQDNVIIMQVQVVDSVKSEDVERIQKLLTQYGLSDCIEVVMTTQDEPKCINPRCSNSPLIEGSFCSDCCQQTRYS
jgi:hypothetical protein